MIAFPNAKINLGLQVLRKRSDGYHDIETVFYPVGWRDALEVVEVKKNEGFKMTATGLAMDVSIENNLCAKAWHLMREKFEIPAVHIHLHKVIPWGAGLGGGSSDAAFTLKLLNRLFQLEQTNEQLETLATNIGSDCAFFIKNKPVLAREKGDVFTSVDIDPDNYKIMIVKPDWEVNTAEAYGKIIPEEKGSLQEIINLKPEYWKDKLVNDFEEIVFKMYPATGEIKNKLYDAGAVYASMSGSGSAVYGLFKKEINLNEIKFEDCRVWAGGVASTIS